MRPPLRDIGLDDDPPDPVAGPLSKAPSRKGQLHTTATATLRQMILSGEIAPGERLREVWICGILGTSRTPVREAVRTLAAEGLVQLLPNRSAVAAAPDPADVAHLFVVMGTIEGLAGELACRRITDKDLAAIAATQHRMVALHRQGERAQYLEQNHAIHRAIVELSGNPVLQGIWEGLLPRVHHARAIANRDPARWREAVYEHSSIFAALAARNGPLLSQLLRDHFLNGLAVVAAEAAGPAGEGDASLDPPITTRRRKARPG